MNILIDTSAFLAVLDKSDDRHHVAASTWSEIIQAGHNLISHNYILVETSAVLMRRFGLEAVRVFVHDVIPILRLLWVTRDIHEAAVAALLMAGRRELSLVDCVSFELMRRTGLRHAFAFDPHFAEFGYTLLPPSKP